MSTCASCRRQIVSGRGKVGIRNRGKAYHLSCAPASLLNTAIEEWDAILSRGVEYFVAKYVPADARPVGKGGPAVVSRFAEIGEKLKAEAKSRRAGAA